MTLAIHRRPSAEMRALIRAETVIACPPILPEIRLHLATEIAPIWQATERILDEIGIDPPFWAFAWAGGQGLARHILDHPKLVAGRTVLDFGAGGGFIAIAAKLAGAAHVRAVDIDPIAAEAMAINAELNGVEITIEQEDLIGSVPGVEVILVGDMCYERPLAERLLRWLRTAAGKGVLVLLGDPGRNYSPSDGIEPLACYEVPTLLELEDRTLRKATVCRLLP